jgi:hypothetical protein
MRSFAVLTSLILAAGCVNKLGVVPADNVVASPGVVQLEPGRNVRFQTKDGFLVTTGLGELNVGETEVCGPLTVYRATPDSPLPAWAPPAGSDWRRFEPVACIARNNIASTTMTVNRTDPVASASCVALLPLCVLAFSVPGQ